MAKPAASPGKVKVEISAGGVIYGVENEVLQIGLIATRGGSQWQLPKGLVEKGEPLEAAAEREVAEETGLRGEVVERLDKIDYWYVWKDDSGRPVRHHKIVYFFLIRHTGGDTSLHDREVDEARWFPIEEALAKLAFPNERRMVELARARLETREEKSG